MDVAPETVELIKAHKSNQAEVKMRNRQQYHDHGLVFAKEWSHVGRKPDVLGDPLQANNLGQREYARLIKAAGVRPIKFHGLRHTSATLMLAADVPSKVVQERLGHKKISNHPRRLRTRAAVDAARRRTTPRRALASALTSAAR